MSNFTATLLKYVLCKIVWDLRWNLNILQANKYTISGSSQICIFSLAHLSIPQSLDNCFLSLQSPILCKSRNAWELFQLFFSKIIFLRYLLMLFFNRLARPAHVFSQCLKSKLTDRIKTVQIGTFQTTKRHCILLYVSLDKGNLDLTYWITTVSIETAQIRTVWITNV
jgi:hypothetical protein